MNQNFGRLRIKEPIIKAIEEAGFKEPTQIQNKAIPYIQEGYDVIATAATGSGKTLAYAVRLIQNSEAGEGVQGIVLVPTRELAKQVGEVLKQFSTYKPLNILIVYGGSSLKEQKNKVHEADIIVGTPGRINEYAQEGYFELGRVKTLVLDEADTMFRSQFMKEIGLILETTPRKKQTLVFSATIPKDMLEPIRRWMNAPRRVFAEGYVESRKLKQVFYEVEPDKKLSLLMHLLKTERAGLSMVFTNRQDTSEFLEKNLKQTGLEIRMIHGDMAQGKRNRIIQDFRDEKFDVLIATDIAARGLDIDDITHIYNYNIPKDPEKYVHRIGRSARAGKSGKIVNFISKTDAEAFVDILKEHKFHVSELELPEFEEVVVKKPLVRKSNKRAMK